MLLLNRQDVVTIVVGKNGVNRVCPRKTRVGHQGLHRFHLFTDIFCFAPNSNPKILRLWAKVHSFVARRDVVRQSNVLFAYYGKKTISSKIGLLRRGLFTADLPCQRLDMGAEHPPWSLAENDIAWITSLCACNNTMLEERKKNGMTRDRFVKEKLFTDTVCRRRH